MHDNDMPLIQNDREPLSQSTEPRSLSQGGSTRIDATESDDRTPNKSSELPSDKGLSALSLFQLGAMLSPSSINIVLDQKCEGMEPIVPKRLAEARHKTASLRKENTIPNAHICDDFRMPCPSSLDEWTSGINEPLISDAQQLLPMNIDQPTSQTTTAIEADILYPKKVNSSVDQGDHPCTGTDIISANDLDSPPDLGQDDESSAPNAGGPNQTQSASSLSGSITTSTETVGDADDSVLVSVSNTLTGEFSQKEISKRLLSEYTMMRDESKEMEDRLASSNWFTKIHQAILFADVGEMAICRLCLGRGGRLFQIRPDEIRPQRVTHEHCDKEHPEECNALKSLTEIGLRELHRRIVS
ncbi:hypothetical protein CPB84DRAFT_564655 [Gymnopilus junonius]|uniref:Uncharacterized protein n=1 Tax=Gymnopilus junonius TaxID=109634 RepID=A0A9P5NT52_GYMJU|nr:hypothetical protein CPB84DRAFT_564655 [Gymnopilus junonius]